MPIEEIPSFWPLGSLVRKTKGSSWQGKVVGHYSTSLTRDGVCVESAAEPGSVQIYPASALEAWDGRLAATRAGLERAAEIALDHRMILDKSSEYACRAIAVAIKQEHPK